MVTRIGSQFVYEDVRMGAAANQNDPHGETIYLTFSDVDNEEVHLFPIAISKLEQYFNLIRQTSTRTKIEIPGGSSD